MLLYTQDVFLNQYFIVVLFTIFSFILSFIVISLSYIISRHSPDSEKTSAYECGFEPFEDARNKFDVRFYVVAILFIIFDMEVIYLFPWVIALPFIQFKGFWSMIIFLIILSLGFAYEIFKGALEWQ